MPSFEHQQIVKDLIQLNSAPSDQEEFSAWIQAKDHLNFLIRNATSDELIVYAGGGYSFIHADVISNEILKSADETELLDWGGTPFRSIASYVSGGGRDDIWLERHQDQRPMMKLQKSMPLVFARTFEGWKGQGQNYFEINQEFTHVSGIHWLPEERAYCRYDERGDLEHVISITERSTKSDAPTCVSFKASAIHDYLSATNSSIIRRFDFTLLRHADFTCWPDEGETRHREAGGHFIYRQKIDPGKAAYTTGIQILTPGKDTVKNSHLRLRGDMPSKYVSFIAQDWRNNKLSEISTDPSLTTNYFETKNNDLPFELSPAFFRPEVVSKYKTDKDKYQIRERSITCRSAWYLKSYDVNEAGQVFAYICDLQRLPYEEQLHWKAFNENPKAPISERAITNDFKGEFTDYKDPLTSLLTTLKRWDQENVSWWKLRDENLAERVSAPLTASVDEWSDSFMDLAMLLVEGFKLAVIRTHLDSLEIHYEKEEQSLKLLKRLLTAKDAAFETNHPSALQRVQLIRSKVRGHSTGEEGKQLIIEAKQKYESLPKHFKSICSELSNELEAIENTFK